MIMSWNRGAERLFGYTAEEAVGKPVTILIPTDRHDEERVILERVRRGESVELRDDSTAQGRKPQAGADG
jgi:PAS domain S-box-containing protein